MEFEMVPVSSSAIKAIGYSDGVLAVEFTSGTVHHYEGVPADAHQELLNAPSIGRHFGKHIRGQFTSVNQSASESE